MKMPTYRKTSLDLARTLCGVAVLVLAATAQAQVTDTGKRHEDTRPQATLNAQATRVVPQDTVVITLAAEVTDATQSAVSQALAQKLDSALKQAKAQAGVKVSSGAYRIWPHNDRKGQITQWQGRGEIVLESSDFGVASELAGKLSDRVAVANIGFQVSPQARARYEQELLTEAAQAFRNRAQAVAVALGFKSYAIRKVDVGGSGAQYQPVPRAMMAMAAAPQAKADVPLEPGTDTITVSMSGSISLDSADK